MTDDLTVTGASSGGTAPGSAETSPSSDDERIKGLQRAVSAKAQEADEARKATAALQERIEQLELAQMSEPERAQVLSQRESSRLTEMQAENERLKLFLKYPDIAPHYQALVSAKTAEEQALYLKRLLNPTAPEPDVSDVDPNNPMRGPSDQISLPPNSVMDAASADRILSLWGNRPARG